MKATFLTKSFFSRCRFRRTNERTDIPRKKTSKSMEPRSRKLRKMKTAGNSELEMGVYEGNNRRLSARCWLRLSEAMKKTSDAL